MADTIRVADYGRIPDPTIIMGIIGGLNDQFRFPIKEKRIRGVLNEGGIIFLGRIIVRRYLA